MTRIRKITIEKDPVSDTQMDHIEHVITAMMNVMAQVLATSMPNGQQPSVSTVLCAMMQGTADRLSGLDRHATGRMMTLLGTLLTDDAPDLDAFVAGMQDQQMQLARAELTLRARLGAGGSA